MPGAFAFHSRDDDRRRSCQPPPVTPSLRLLPFCGLPCACGGGPVCFGAVCLFVLGLAGCGRRWVWPGGMIGRVGLRVGEFDAWLVPLRAWPGGTAGALPRRAGVVAGRPVCVAVGVPARWLCRCARRRA